MSDLITALQIFLKYGNPHNPTHCNHDELIVCIDPEKVSEEDKQALNKLGFQEAEYGFVSWRFGSA